MKNRGDKNSEIKNYSEFRGLKSRDWKIPNPGDKNPETKKIPNPDDKNPETKKIPNPGDKNLEIFGIFRSNPKLKIPIWNKSHPESKSGF